jgi:hypothetical protein
MSHYPDGTPAHQLSEGRIVERGLEAGAAMYALDHAAKGTPIGAEGGIAAQATRTAGNFVIVAFLFPFLVIPYLVGTAAVFALPTIIAALIDAGVHGGVAGGVLVGLVFLASLVMWVRFALYKWLYRKFIRPVDAALSGRKLDDPARKPKTRFRESPTQYLAEYNALSKKAAADYLQARRDQ